MFTVSTVTVTDGERTYEGEYDQDGVLIAVWIKPRFAYDQEFALRSGDDGFLLVASAIYEAANGRFGQ